MILLIPTVLAQTTPDDLAAGAAEARETLEGCAQQGCPRLDGAEAAFVLAVFEYVSTGEADGTLAATVEVLAPDLHADLPPAVRAAEGEAMEWAGRVGGPAPGTLVIGGTRVRAVQVDSAGEWTPTPSPDLPPDLGAPASRALFADAIRAEHQQKLRSAIELHRQVMDAEEGELGAIAAARVAAIYTALDKPEMAVSYLEWIRAIPSDRFPDIDLDLAEALHAADRDDEARKVLRKHRRSSERAASLWESLD